MKTNTHVNKDPYDVDLDEEEQMWEDLLESGALRTIPDFEKAKKALAQSARDTRLKTKQISIRVNEADLARLRAQAIREGMPYQTLINSIIHKHATGQVCK